MDQETATTCTMQECHVIAPTTTTTTSSYRGVRQRNPKMPRPTSSKPEDIQVAAQQAALMFKRSPTMSPNNNQGCCGSCERLRVGLSATKIQAINECPLDSPKMWMMQNGRSTQVWV
ncbi:Ethylene-responsive transcription factor [Glycine max]|nr:Ethylene-responsive transcription factor [Glycine max]